MLNPVGLVDAGRISQDTGHSFDASRDAASGIAARYYMNRNFFIADPDAFTVSTQTVDDPILARRAAPTHSRRGAGCPLHWLRFRAACSRSETIFPRWGLLRNGCPLVRNADLIDMARLGRSSTPVDLMTYAPGDKQPSVFLLKENDRQSILTIFNWTDGESTRAIDFARLGLKDPGKYRLVDVFGDPGCCSSKSGTIKVVQKPHSVRMLKLVDDAVPAVEPPFEIRSATRGKAGETLTFAASAPSSGAPVLTCHWDFGDGSSMDGMEVQHAFTHTREYEVNVTVTGLEAARNRKTFTVSISGDVSTRFEPADKQRPERTE